MHAYDNRASIYYDILLVCKRLTPLVNIPLDAPLSVLGTFVNQAVQPLFEAFDGFELSSDVVEDLTQRLIERKL